METEISGKNHRKFKRKLKLGQIQMPNYNSKAYKNIKK